MGKFARQVSRNGVKTTKYGYLAKKYQPGKIGSQDHAGLEPRSVRREVSKKSGTDFVPQYN